MSGAGDACLRQTVLTPSPDDATALASPQAAPTTPALRAGLFIDMAGVLLDTTPASASGRRPGLRGGVGGALRLLDRLDYRIVVLGPCGLDRRQAAGVAPARIADLLARERIALTACRVCGAATPPCRSCPPASVWLARAAQEHGLALGASWLLAGDARYLAAGRQAGCRVMLVDAAGNDGWRMPPTCGRGAAGPAVYQARDIVDAALAIVRLDGQR